MSKRRLTDLLYKIDKTHEGHIMYNIQKEEHFTYRSIALYIPAINHIYVDSKHSYKMLKGELRFYKK